MRKIAFLIGLFTLVALICFALIKNGEAAVTTLQEPAEHPLAFPIIAEHHLPADEVITMVYKFTIMPGMDYFYTESGNIGRFYVWIFDEEPKVVATISNVAGESCTNPEYVDYRGGWEDLEYVLYCSEDGIRVNVAIDGTFWIEHYDEYQRMPRVNEWRFDKAILPQGIERDFDQTNWVGRYSFGAADYWDIPASFNGRNITVLSKGISPMFPYGVLMLPEADIISHAQYSIVSLPTEYGSTNVFTVGVLYNDGTYGVARFAGRIPMYFVNGE